MPDGDILYSRVLAGKDGAPALKGSVEGPLKGPYLKGPAFEESFANIVLSAASGSSRRLQRPAKESWPAPPHDGPPPGWRVSGQGRENSCRVRSQHSHKLARGAHMRTFLRFEIPSQIRAAQFGSSLISRLRLRKLPPTRDFLVNSKSGGASVQFVKSAHCRSYAIILGRRSRPDGIRRESYTDYIHT